MPHSSQNIKWQTDIGSISDRIWDVIIIGAGPAGATTAAYLAANHHRVLLLDRKAFPREKICGDGLLPDTLRCLDDLGIGDVVRKEGNQLNTATIFSPSQSEIDVCGTYLTIKRSRLDMIIAKRAIDSGAAFAFGEVARIRIDSDDRLLFEIKGSNKGFSARIGVVATGANVRLPGRMKWSAKKRPSAVALRCYIRSPYALDRLIVSYDKSILPGYAWIFPLKDHEYNVGCGISLSRHQATKINLRKIFFNFIEEFPLARELMRQSRGVTALQRAALRCDFEGVYPVVYGSIVAVGETIGTTLPFLAEGIGKAMESAKIAADAIDAALAAENSDMLVQYSRQIESELKPRYHSYRLAEKWIARPVIGDYVLSRFGKSKFAQNVLAGIVDETRVPSELFSLKGILKTFWK